MAMLGLGIFNSVNCSWKGKINACKMHAYICVQISWKYKLKKPFYKFWPAQMVWVLNYLIYLISVSNSLCIYWIHCNLGMNSQNIMITHIFTFIAVVVKKHVSCLTWTLPKSTWIGICGSCALSIVYTWVTNSDVPFKRRKAKRINTLWMFVILFHLW